MPFDLRKFTRKGFTKKSPPAENSRLIVYHFLLTIYNSVVMGLAKLKTKISVEEYLEGERLSPVKHEYVYGEGYAMAGTSDNHNRIAVNITTALANHLRDSPCEPFFGDIKVRVNPNVYYYPDVLF